MQTGVLPFHPLLSLSGWLSALRLEVAQLIDWSRAGYKYFPGEEFVVKATSSERVTHVRVYVAGHKVMLTVSSKNR